jgi:hypothetical protein
MSKILQRGDTGFGILIEQDAGYISKELNSGLLTEGVLDISSIKPGEPILINCVLQKWGVENKNGRIYPKEVLIPQVEEYQKIVADSSAVSEADHPDSSVVSLHNIAHLIKKMWWGTGENEHILFGQLQLAVTPGFLKFGIASMIGDKVLVYLDMGIKLGISSRGVGTLTEADGKNIVQDDFELICFDLVASPSTPGAYLFPNKNELDIGSGSLGLGMGEMLKLDGQSLNEQQKRVSGAIDKFLI